MPLILSPTHEEEITALVAGTTLSKHDFPLRLYQISESLPTLSQTEDFD